MKKFAVLGFVLLLSLNGEASKMQDALKQHEDNVNHRIVGDIREMALKKLEIQKESALAHHPQHHRHQHFPPPTFLKNVSAQARREFYSIITSDDITRNEMKKELQAWAKKEDLTVELNQYLETIKLVVEEWHKNTTHIIDELPKAYNEIHKILSNADLTRQQAKENILNLKIEPGVARTLKALMFYAVHSKSDKDMKDGDEVEEIINIVEPASSVFGVEGGYEFDESFEKKGNADASNMFN